MASRSMNKAILIGNLTRDPELKYTPNGTSVCTFGVATNRSWTTTDGQIKEDTQFHRVVAWQKLAELCGKLLTKGKKIYMEGRITYRSFVGKDGQQRSITEIVLDDFIMFDSGKRIVPGEGVTPPVAPPHVDVTVAPEKQSETPTQQNNHTETVNPEDIPF